MANSILTSDVYMGSPTEDCTIITNTIDDFSQNVIEEPNTNLFGDSSQMIDLYEPVPNRKGMASYKYGTSGTSSGSEYDPTKDSVNYSDSDSNQAKKAKKDDKTVDITKGIKKNNKKKGKNGNKGKWTQQNASGTRRKTSIAWKEGAFKCKPGDSTKVICGQCALEGRDYEQKLVNGGSTSTLLNHLKNHHPIFYKKHKGLPDEKQRHFASYFYDTVGWKRNGEQSKKFDHLLVRFVVATNSSPCIIKSPEFKKLLPTQYNLPDSTEFAKLLKEKKVQIKKQIHNEVQKCNYIGVQFSNYTSSNKYPYCYVSVSLVKQDFNLKTIILESIKFDPTSKAVNVFELMEGSEGMIQKAKLSDTMRTYTTDNCEDMETYFDDKFGLTCFGQLLDLAIRQGLKQVTAIDELITKLHKLSTSLNHCPGALSLLKDDEEWLGFPNLTVLTEVPSRWNLLLKSGKRILEIKEDVVLFFQFIAKTDINITNEDFILLQELCKNLEVFDESFLNIQYNTEFTINTVMPILNQIKDKLDPENDINSKNDKNDIVIWEFRKKLVENLGEMYTNEKSKTLLMTATALDPSLFRIKKYRSTEYKNSLKETVIKIAKNMPNSNKESQSQYPATPGQEMSSLSKFLKLNCQASTPASRNKTFIRKASRSLNIYSSESEDDESSQSQTNSKSIECIVEEEIEDYICDVDKNSKDIKYQIKSGQWSLSGWWQTHEKRFKYLSETVKAVLCVRASNSSCERTLLTNTNTITKFHNMFDNDSVEALTFLKNNYKYLPEDYETLIQKFDSENDSSKD